MIDDNEVPEGLTQEQLEAHFSALATELFDKDISVPSLIEKEKKKLPPVYRGYIPGIHDFLARATTIDECEEIIKFCLYKKDIDDKKAAELRNILKEKGPEGFGNRKPGHYDNSGLNC